MQITGKHSFTIVKKEGFVIAKYECRAVLPNGKAVNSVIIKGRDLPEDKVSYLFTGEFTSYRTAKGAGWSFAAERFEEILPDETSAVISYLATLKGIGRITAKALADRFGKGVFDVIARKPEELEKIKGISPSKAKTIQKEFLKRQGARELFPLLLPAGLSEGEVYRALKALAEEDPASALKKDPYLILNGTGIPFEKGDALAKSLGLHSDDPRRVRAAVAYAVYQSETGGKLLSRSFPCPSFMTDGFLRDDLMILLRDEHLFLSGNTYIPRDELYIQTLKLLKRRIPEDVFDAVLRKMNLDGMIYLAKERETLIISRPKTALSEIEAAKAIKNLIAARIKPEADLSAVIAQCEKEAGISLSEEQVFAVEKAVTSPVSIITGGPGTGKTSVLKIVLDVFSKIRPLEDSLLLAPTGKAAKRLSQQTGKEALTIHRALKLYPSGEGELYDSDGMMRFSERLIIVDEVSMVGSHLFAALLKHVCPGTRLVLVGDQDQLPSIEAGAVLRELISCGVLPVTSLKRTYRQKSGSTIVLNAGKIRRGDPALEKGEDFIIITCENSDRIADKVEELAPQLIKEHEDLLCLSAFKRKTASSSKALNGRLSRILNPDENAPFFFSKGERIRLGDRVIFTRNTVSLANGDIGIVASIWKTAESISVSVDFDGNTVTIEDEETQALELAYALTVHKSQGCEASCVILALDAAHAAMLKRPLIYTAVTRAKEKLYLICSKDAVNLAVKTQDCVLRRSRLSELLMQ